MRLAGGVMTNGGISTVVLVKAVLLDATWSMAAALLTDTVLCKLPDASARKRIVTSAPACEFSEPRSQRTTPPTFAHVPWLAVALTKVVVDGTGLDTTTRSAVDGPRLVIVATHVTT